MQHKPPFLAKVGALPVLIAMSTVSVKGTEKAAVRAILDGGHDGVKRINGDSVLGVPGAHSSTDGCAIELAGRLDGVKGHDASKVGACSEERRGGKGIFIP